MTSLRVSASLGGGFQNTPHRAWNLKPYKSRNEPAVFFGMYDLRDFIALWRHKNKKYLLWAGGDILNLSRGFICNDGKLRWLSDLLPGFKFILKKILKDVEHWVENEVEREALLKWGIKEVNVCPSYLGNVNMPVTYEWRRYPKVYASCSGNQQVAYGFDVIERIAPRLPMITFYLYGAEWKTNCKNIIVRGRIPIQQMNEETAGMQASIRCNESDGFSELLAKAILRGQYAVSRIPYPLIPSYENEEELIQYLRSLTIMYQPNYKARDYYIKTLNKYPWNAKLF